MERINENKSQLRNPRQMVSDMIKDLWQSRYLGWTLAIRDIKAKYRAAWLGVAWAILPALATTLTFVALQRQQLLNVNSGEVPYPVFTMTGIVLWQIFSESVMAPLQIVQASKSLLAKILFPREALLVSAIIQVTFNFMVKLGFLGVVILWYGVPLSGGGIAVPFICVSLLGLGILIGVFLVPVGVLYQDIIFSLGTVLTLLMLVTPIGYSAPQGGLLGDLNLWNPVAYLIQGGRDLLFHGTSYMLTEMILITGVTFIGLLVGWILYRLTFPIVVERFSS